MMELQTMNKIPIYTIVQIEAEDAEIPMLTFYVKEDAVDEPEEISMEELTAYDRNLGIGDQVIIGPDETLFPLDMAENLGGNKPKFMKINPLKAEKLMEMNVFMQKLQIKQKACYIEQNGSGGPIILWGMYPHRGNEIAHMWDCLMETVNDQDFLFCAFQVKDWNGDFSPWKSPAAFGDDDFKGNGPKTLQWLMNDLIPKLKADYGVDREIYLIGYSLAGLFALWTAYETDIFSAIASCSGSLWFEQWDEYVLHHQIKHESNIYLSLGGKEEKTKNPVMARVGDRTRTQERILRNDPKVKQTTLEFNSGGHFADAQKRLAKAVKWLLECT